MDSVIKGFRASDEIKRIYAEFDAEDNAQLEEDVKALLKLGAARRVLMRILAREHVFSPLGEAGEAQAQILIEVGRHNLAQDILSMANRIDPEAVASATREHHDIMRLRNQRIEAFVNQYEGTEK